jgi:5-methyltetrahydropteroyltriglutamate--homocysteine methyltransferase
MLSPGRAGEVNVPTCTQAFRPHNASLHNAILPPGEEAKVKSSSDRILTTHTGSLPRSKTLSALLVKREQRKPYDENALRTEIDRNLDLVVARQRECGVDIGNDGETPRVGFSTYTTERIAGFGGESRRKPTLDTIKFPGFADFMARQIGVSDELARVWNAPQAVGKLEYDQSLSEAKSESAAFKASLKRTGSKFTEDFMTAATPGIVSTTMLLAPDNPAYKNDAEYVMGIANELKKEYEYIVGEGYILQLDAPDLAMERVIMFGDQPLKDFLDRVALHVDAINVAIADIPPEKVRLHVCWGNWNGPHQDDVDVADLLPILYGAKVGALSIPLGNPRHEHETEVFKKLPLPNDMLLIPGVIDVTTNYLEHPVVVANRICAAVTAVGARERVIAGTDCGFGTFASYEFIAEDVVWAKLKALSDGAKLATARLWGKA